MAYDAFLKLDTIAGESMDKDHKGWSDVLSFHWGIGSTGNQGAGAGGGSRVEELTLSKYVDSASPGALGALCSGAHLRTVTLEFHKVRDQSSGLLFLKYEFTDVLISGLKVGDAVGSNDRPLEELTLDFAGVTETYYPSGASSAEVPFLKGSCSMPRRNNN